MQTNKIKPPREKMFEGNEKIFYYNEEQEYGLTQHFKDSIKFPDGTITDIPGLGVLRNSISAFLMEKLDMVGIDHHLISKLNMREQSIQMVDALPCKISVTYLACGRYVTDFKMEQGLVFEVPLIDFYYKTKDGYAVVNEEHIMHMCYLNSHTMKEVKRIAIKTADFLTGFFAGCGIRLVQANFTLGVVFDGAEFKMVVADEISPATCRLWDLKDNAKLGFEEIMINPHRAVEICKEVSSRIGNE